MHTTPESELRTLSALVTRVNSSLDVAQVLDQAIEVCAELSGCEGALVYLWDEEQQRLVIRSAVEGYRHWIGAFGLELGEGLTGWTALSRRPGIITEDALADPRFKHVPELNDTRFQSVLTVPIVGRGDRLAGVITLHTVAPHEFSEDDLTAAETIASLVAGALENAKLHEQALRSVEVFRSLADLSRRMALSARAPETLQRLALTALELLDAALVVVLRHDERRSRLVVETWVGGGGVSVDAVPADPFWLRLLGGGPASVPVDGGAPVASRLDARSLFASPLVHEGRPIGLLCCYATERRSLGDDNLALLGTIANHTAIVLAQGRAAAGDDRRSLVRGLFEALRAGERPVELAAELGVRLDEPCVAVVAEAADDADAAWAALGAELAQVFPGTVVDPRRSFTALVPVRSERWAGLLENAIERVLDGREAAAGFSDATGPDTDHALALRQASMACAVARSSGPARRVRGYSGLGAQRYLWAMSRERDPDPLELALTRLRELDRRRGSELFRTLEAYLERQGNAQQAAATLYVHRNTLRQRLRRIREVVGLDPADPTTWFELQLAVRLIRFRESEPL